MGRLFFGRSAWRSSARGKPHGTPKTREIRDFEAEIQPKTPFREASKCLVLPNQARPRGSKIVHIAFALNRCEERHIQKFSGFGRLGVVEVGLDEALRGSLL